MKCWNCNQLISHKNVKWKPRKVGCSFGDPLASYVTTLMMQEVERKRGNKDAISSPNKIFGMYEYEYRGSCPRCKVELTSFWFGEDSIKKNKNKVIEEKPFLCSECKNEINRELQVWYSITIKEEDKVTEYLVTMCPNCQSQQIYPFEYDLEYGIIK